MHTCTTLVGLLLALGVLVSPTLGGKVCPTGATADVGEAEDVGFTLESSSDGDDVKEVEEDTKEETPDVEEETADAGHSSDKPGKPDKGTGGARARRAELDQSGSGSSGSGSEDQTVEEVTRRVQINVQGQSGKFSVFDADADGPACDPNTITITMDALSEVDADGNAVGASGSVKHSINSFATQQFEFAPQEDDVAIGTATATKVSFTTPFKGLGDSTLAVHTYLITHSGDVGTDTETWAVNQGDIKFNLALADWDWCGGTAECGKGQAVEVGAFIDVVVSVKGPRTAKAAAGGKSVDLGGASIELSNRVQLDGEWTNMPDGFPLITTKGSSTVFTFRIPKFVSSALYDPVITSGGIAPLVTTNSDGSTSVDNADGSTTTTNADGTVTTTDVAGNPITTAAPADTTTAPEGVPSSAPVLSLTASIVVATIAAAMV